MANSVQRELPDADDIGTSGTWVVTDRSGIEHRIAGTFLGMGTTYRPDHKNHHSSVSAPPGVHCSTCRWTELRLFRMRADVGGALFIVNCGASDVAGERDFIKVTQVDTAFELIEALTTADRQTRRTVLPMPARRALAQAASHDRDVRDAYINSPVT